jgi:hypothetical protein
MPGFLGIGRRHRGAPQWKSRSFHHGRVAVNSNDVDFRRHSLRTGRHVQARQRLCGILENGRLPLTYTGIQIPAPDLEEIGQILGEGARGCISLGGNALFRGSQ